MVSKASHYAYDAHYHVVLVMKYRRKILVPEYIEYLCQLLEEIAKQWEFEIEEFGSDGDHVHILLSSPPRYSLSKIMNVVKGTTGKMMFRRFPELRERLWSHEFWSDGGYIGTIGQYAGMEGVVKYIQKQGGKVRSQRVLTDF